MNFVNKKAAGVFALCLWFACNACLCNKQADVAYQSGRKASMLLENKVRNG